VNPKPQQLDVLRRQEAVALLVPCSFVGETVVPAVQFNCELGQRAVEVEEVRAAGVLPTKLELREAPVTEQPPEPLLRLRGFLAEMPGKVACVLRARAMLAKLLEAHRPLLPLPHRGRGLG